MALTNSRIYKVAGLSLLGFCALSFGADRANVGPVATQVAGFFGAFLGALAAPRRRRRSPHPEDEPVRSRETAENGDSPR